MTPSKKQTRCNRCQKETRQFFKVTCHPSQTTIEPLETDHKIAWFTEICHDCVIELYDFILVKV